MSDGANKNFLASPVSWLKNNVLICDVNSVIAGSNSIAGSSTADESANLKEIRNRFEAGTVIDCNIEKSFDRGKLADGKMIPVWKLRAPVGGAGIFSNRFKAYYLPFRNNDIRTMQLSPTLFPPGANFFFTDTINGCSIAVGPGAAPKVGHFNRTVGGVADGMIDQNAINHDISMEFSGGTVIKLTKSTYKSGVGCEATIFGIKWMGAWTFYWQARDLSGYVPKDKKGNQGKIWDVGVNELKIADGFG